MSEVCDDGKRPDSSRVIVGRKLQELLAKKRVRFILLDVAFSKSCGGAVGELYARGIQESEA